MITAWLPTERGLQRHEVIAGVIPAESVWLDAMDITPEEKLALEAACDITVPTRAEMQELEVSSRLYREGQSVYLTSTMLIKTETESPENSAVTYVLTPRRLVTLRYAEPWSFRIFGVRAPKSGVRTPELVFVALLDTTVERLADLLELVAVELETMSQRIFRRPQKQNTIKELDLQRVIHNIGRCGNINSKVRESLLDKQRLVSFVDQAGDGWLCAEAKAHLHATQRDVQSLSDHATFTSGKINFLLDASLGLINNNLNRQMKVLSAIMIAVMWPALVSGFFAMNVKLPMPQPPDRAEMWPFYLCLGLAFGPLLIGFGMWWWRPRR